MPPSPVSFLLDVTELKVTVPNEFTTKPDTSLPANRFTPLTVTFCGVEIRAPELSNVTPLPVTLFWAVTVLTEIALLEMISRPSNWLELNTFVPVSFTACAAPEPFGMLYKYAPYPVCD